MFPDQRVARPVSASWDNPNQIQNNFEPVEENPEKDHQTLAVEGVKNFTRNQGVWSPCEESLPKLPRFFNQTQWASSAKHFSADSHHKCFP